jgi:hypothetical protein
MNRAERRKKLETKFKKRLKYWTNVGYSVMGADGKWRYAKNWKELKTHHEFRDQCTPCENGAWKSWNTRRLKKEAFKRIQEQLDEINRETTYDYYKVNIKSRFSDIRDKTWR